VEKTTRHVGIVGVTAEGASLCYRTICLEGASVLGPHAHPQVTMHTRSLADYVPHIEAGRWDQVGQLLLSSAQKVVAAGADFLLCPDNTVHGALDVIRERSPVPWLHIAEEVASVAASRGFRRLGVLGTRLLMEGPVYRRCLGALNIEAEIPDAADRGIINDVIWKELVIGQLRQESRRAFQSIIEKLGARGCDAVVLGCTEIPLLISDADSSLPAIDSTRTLARAALREALR
jgi:aspartate racemase